MPCVGAAAWAALLQVTQTFAGDAVPYRWRGGHAAQGSRKAGVLPVSQPRGSAPCPVLPSSELGEGRPQKEEVGTPEGQLDRVGDSRCPSASPALPEADTSEAVPEVPAWGEAVVLAAGCWVRQGAPLDGLRRAVYHGLGKDLRRYHLGRGELGPGAWDVGGHSARGLSPGLASPSPAAQARLR